MRETIYLHGAGLNAESWGDVPGRALNLPGYGGRPRAAKPSVAAMADALQSEIPDGAALVGHSLGGMVALDLAARLGERIRALVLIDTPLTLQVPLVHRLGPWIAPALVSLVGPKWIGRVVSYRIEREAGRAAFHRWLAENDPKALSDAMTAAATFDGAPLARRIKVPMLAIMGSSSFLTRPPCLRRLRAACPQLKDVTFDTGHMIPIDRPVQMQAAITKFLEKLP